MNQPRHRVGIDLGRVTDIDSLTATTSPKRGIDLARRLRRFDELPPPCPARLAADLGEFDVDQSPAATARSRDADHGKLALCDHSCLAESVRSSNSPDRSARKMVGTNGTARHAPVGRHRARPARALGFGGTTAIDIAIAIAHRAGPNPPLVTGRPDFPMDRGSACPRRRCRPSGGCRPLPARAFANARKIVAAPGKSPGAAILGNGPGEPLRRFVVSSISCHKGRAGLQRSVSRARADRATSAPSATPRTATHARFHRHSNPSLPGTPNGNTTRAAMGAARLMTHPSNAIGTPPATRANNGGFRPRTAKARPKRARTRPVRSRLPPLRCSAPCAAREDDTRRLRGGHNSSRIRPPRRAAAYNAFRRGARP